MLCAIGAAPASAQTFPAGSIRIVVGSGVSTPSDILARVIANELVNAEKWTVVVENRAGASNVIGGLEAFARVAAEPVGGAPEVFGAVLKRDVDKWSGVIAKSGIKPK